MALTKYNRRDFYNIVTLDGINQLDWMSFQWIAFAKALSTDQCQIHIIREFEQGRLWILSELYYGTVELDWLIALVNGVMDMYNDVLTGLTLAIPSLSSIEAFYQQIRSVARTNSSVNLPTVTTG